MKKLILFIAILCYANETKEILKMIDLLQTQKISYKPIKKLYNPFINEEKQKIISNNIDFGYFIPKKEKKVYDLEIVFQNKVRINGKWYKNNDKIDQYKIIIKDESVYLKNKKKLIKLKRKRLLKVTE